MTTAANDSDLPLRSSSPITAYARFWQRYAVFTGRASRSEYWWAALFNAVAIVVLGIGSIVLIAIGADAVRQDAPIGALPNGVGAVLGFLAVVYLLAEIVPNIAISVRRLHDADLSGLFVLLAFVPSVGGLILLVLHVLPANPSGARFDRRSAGMTPQYAAAPTTPMVPPPPVIAASVPAPLPNGGFDRWPAPASAHPATAPMPTSPPADTADAPDDAVHRAWEGIGEVRTVQPRLSAQPSWRRQGYLFVHGAGGIDVVSTNGLGNAEGAAALGPGAEVYLAGNGFGESDDDIARDWRFTLVAAVARRIGASGMHLPAELEQYGALSMTVQADAPEGWSGLDGSVGVLIGVGLPGLPDTVVTRAGEIRLVGIAPLRPEELQRILDGGREARADLAARLASLPPARLVDADRPAV